MTPTPVRPARVGPALARPPAQPSGAAMPADSAAEL